MGGLDVGCEKDSVSKCRGLEGIVCERDCIVLFFILITAYQMGFSERKEVCAVL